MSPGKWWEAVAWGQARSVRAAKLFGSCPIKRHPRAAGVVMPRPLPGAIRESPLREVYVGKLVYPSFRSWRVFPSVARGQGWLPGAGDKPPRYISHPRPSWIPACAGLTNGGRPSARCGVLGSNPSRFRAWLAVRRSRLLLPSGPTWF